MTISRKLAHKVQNMLQEIMGYIDLACHRAEENCPARQNCMVQLQKARDAIRRLSRLIGENTREFEPRKKTNGKS